jgi:hypothetical protein
MTYTNPVENDLNSSDIVELSTSKKIGAQSGDKNLVKKAHTKNLTASIVKIEDLTSIEIERMYNIFSKYYENHDSFVFKKDLSEKNHVILLRDHNNQTIQGFSTILKNSMPNGIAIFSGDTVLEKEYWGNKALGVAFLKYLWLEKVKNPWTPVYWFLISKGYKTYLLMANNFKNHYPRFDKSTPSSIKKITDDYYSQKFSNSYDSQKGIIKFSESSCRLKEKVADIDSKLLQNPKIKFFASINPGWAEGQELACIAEMTFLMPFQYFLKKTFFKGKK